MVDSSVCFSEDFSNENNNNQLQIFDFCVGDFIGLFRP